MGPCDFSAPAKRDLHEIGRYIARDNADAADALVDRIKATCELLAANPMMGQRRLGFTDPDLRSFSIGNYVLYFRPRENGIVIARVLHGSRDHSQLL